MPTGKKRTKPDRWVANDAICTVVMFVKVVVCVLSLCFSLNQKHRKLLQINLKESIFGPYLRLFPIQITKPDY